MLQTLIPVSSSVIRAIGYDGRTLTVQFRTGRTYGHPNVPPEVHAAIMAAPSIGGFYNRFVRGKYR